MLDEVILTREAIAALARAVINRTVAEDRVVDAGLMALQVRETSKGFAAVVASEWLGRSTKKVDVSLTIVI
jgi:predicted S18 family serine protease